MSRERIPLDWINEDKKSNNELSTDPQKDSPIRRRKIRSDKSRDIKFPVSKSEQIRLKTVCKQADIFYKKIYGYDKKLTQTHFNTLLLNYALKQLDEVDWHKVYLDSKMYMHTKPTETEYTAIGGPYGLSTMKGISDRKVVYFLVITALENLERQGDYNSVLL
ncbi:hypothetical protein LG296_20520 (plasmid) [Ureibacillus chungkukjangi]|uniref:hypothetical protein n=1 Tax=Ureibacillus chungkukjangi TaxID=1202712 RepID=UPI000D3424FD|nr:hypothetical protein [Ureibacillus chungkukjangi]MCM3390432.1 hypothetical protein [Ureibacillus chungkukjangi]